MRKRNRAVLERGESSTSRSDCLENTKYSHYKRSKINKFNTDFLPKYTAQHAKENRYDHIKLKKQTKIVKSGPLCDASGRPHLPLDEKYTDALKGNIVNLYDPIDAHMFLFYITN